MYLRSPCVLFPSNKLAVPFLKYITVCIVINLYKYINLFQNGVKAVNMEHKNETAQISELLVKLKADAPELADKVAELQKLDK